MNRLEALDRLRSVAVDKNLHELAVQFDVTIRKGGKLNKGWMGLTLERVAGLPISCEQRPDGDDFELKSTTFVKRGANWVPKETIRVTQFNPQTILEETFETSALWRKLSSMILVACRSESDERCYVHGITTIDLEDPELVGNVREFWEDLRYAVCVGEIAQLKDVGRSTDFLQLRPTGNGKQTSTCPVTLEKFPARAIYATKTFLTRLLV